ncbi:MAG TPA: formate/nitrite transporter family protein [Thermoanaerobaculia bacterium]|nr:formate/nitrite transporter family protein [Thermoanaerobaculia bacterium]
MADPEKQKQDAEERSAPSGAVVYKAIRSEGEDELERSTSALAWSGLAAGLSMGFSFLAQGVLHSHLPNAGWRPLLSSFGYSIGFLIVILGRQQLFTENTLTVILPLLARRDRKTMHNVARLWVTVFLANLVGAMAFAFALARTRLFSDNVGFALLRVAEASFLADFWTTVLRGVFAGWLIATMVWLLPFAESARVWVIIIITYVVGLAGFSHVIAGSVEAMYLAAGGHISWYDCFGLYVMPALIGNVIGGVSLVAAINHAQVVAGGDGKDL